MENIVIGGISYKGEIRGLCWGKDLSRGYSSQLFSVYFLAYNGRNLKVQPRWDVVAWYVLNPIFSLSYGRVCLLILVKLLFGLKT